MTDTLPENPDPKLLLPRGGVAFAEAIARGIECARDRLRLALCRMHDGGDGKEYGPELAEEDAKAIEKAVEAFIRDDETLRAIDEALVECKAEWRQRADELACVEQVAR